MDHAVKKLYTADTAAIFLSVRAKEMKVRIISLLSSFLSARHKEGMHDSALFTIFRSTLLILC